MSTPIVVEQLTKRFGSFEAVRDVSFTAPGGAITALLGPSGSGKSTVLRMIAGLEDPNEGRIWLGDVELTPKSVQERRVGFVFQHYALFRHMTVAAERGVRARRAKAGEEPIGRRASTSCSSSCSSRTSRSDTPTSSRAGSASGWRWRVRWPRGPRCCCSTSRSARSTRRCARTCGSGSTSCIASSA